ncbi:hypothetical protein [Sphingobacterium sp. SYP-B4668]|uniref:hypothetical protein n=1 Tax=Sphingobacterium sp. SYP-B4668 TaxID=2996035 RepID=UPI0022DD4E96|nr:hypothetical protein [Sphingobacterium sp. SYP-B4668]
MSSSLHLNRRHFLATGAIALGAFLTAPLSFGSTNGLPIIDRGPRGLVPAHFPSRLHAFVWRNWNLVPVERMAKTVDTDSSHIIQLADEMRLPPQEVVSPGQWERSYLTVIRRNWHLLPEDQLLTLMDWDKAKLEFTLVEDDFFYIKLGSLKPHCDALLWADTMSKLDLKKVERFGQYLDTLYPSGVPGVKEPYFHFVHELSAADTRTYNSSSIGSGFSPRIAYPYFALFGDPLLSNSTESYPDAYLDRMHAKGVDSIWMHIVLSKITPFPWDPTQSQDWELRLANLSKLVQRARKRGIRLFLYLNEPRNQSEQFFRQYPALKGSGYSLCTSIPAVSDYLKSSLALVASSVPGLGGFFSITASENPTNCWSHGQGDQCSHCSKLGAASVISTLNNNYLEGIKQGYEQLDRNVEYECPQLIVWDWGWRDGLAEEVLPALHRQSLAFMSVSEWDLPIERGGIQSKVGEYSISSIGPGPRASRHWALANSLGISCVAKIQANNSWEIAAVPYIPALFNVGQHIDNLRKANVKGLMLGWSLGGYPSPNLSLVNLLGAHPAMTVRQAIDLVAEEFYGKVAAEAVVRAWKSFSDAFRQFPYHVGVVYSAPLQSGPSNLLWSQPTGYRATMVGLAYDDLASWRSIYPTDIFIQQLTKTAIGFKDALAILRQDTRDIVIESEHLYALQRELSIAETVYLHYQSVANQCRFVVLRDRLVADDTLRSAILSDMIALLEHELSIARRLAEIQSNDSRIGFEASNQYFYVGQDLHEKVINCYDLIAHYNSL